MGNLDAAGSARCRMPVRRRSIGLPRPRGDHADAARGRRRDVRGAGQLGNPSSLHTAGPPGAPGGRGVARSRSRRPRRPAQRGGVHQRRHRGGQPRHQGPVLGPARRGSRPARVLVTAIEHHAVLDSVRWLAEHEGAEVGWLPVDARRPGQPPTLRARSSSATRRRRADQRHVGQQRGRHRPADRRAGRGGRRARDPVPHRRRAGGRAAAGRPRRQRRRRAHHHRAQDRRPGRRRRAAAGRASSRCRCCTAAARSATSGPARWTPRRSGPSRSRSSSPPSAAATRPSGSPRLRDDLIAQVLAAVPDAVLNGAPPGPAPAAGQRPLLVPRLRGRRAADAARRQGHRVLHRLGLHRRAWPSPATCCSRWARTRPGRAGRCGSRSATRPTQADVDALGAVIGEAVERARRAQPR